MFHRAFASRSRPFKNQYTQTILQRVQQTNFSRSSQLSTGLVLGLSAFGLALVSFGKVLAEEEEKKEKIIVVGSGWGGLSFIKSLDTTKFDVHLISPENYFLFTPMLFGVITGKLEPVSITTPLRTYLPNNKKSVTYHEGSVTDVDFEKQTITYQLKGSSKNYESDYDKLVLAIGRSSSIPGNINAKKVPNIYTLSTLEDAVAIRARLIDLLERASEPSLSDEELKKLLNLVVVGGSPVTQQLVVELSDFITGAVYQTYPHLQGKVTVTQVNDSRSIANTYEAKICEALSAIKQKRKVKIIENHFVDSVDPSLLHLRNEKNGERSSIPFGVCIYTISGPHDLVRTIKKKLPKEQVHETALITTPYLNLKGVENVFAIGDCASVDQDRLFHRWKKLFEALDVNKDGVISKDEFSTIVEDYSAYYPQLLELGKQVNELFEEADIDKNGTLDQTEFRNILKKVDSKLTSLPATAQVAVQEGKYVAASLTNQTGYLRAPHLDGKKDEDDEIFSKKPPKKIEEDDDDDDDDDEEDEQFRYKHLGGFEYVGYENEMTERGSDSRSIIDGPGAIWLWRSIFFSRIFPLHVKIRFLLNSVTSKIFGRNITGV